MKSQTTPDSSPLALARAFCSRIGRTVAFSLLICAVGVPLARATLPAGTTTTALYKKGFLDVTRYANVTVNGAFSTATATTAGLNEAINDAREYGVVLYFPEGTYLINDTLKAYTATGSASSTNGLMMVGSTLGARPTIKLAAGSTGFTSAATPKPVVEFKNFLDDTFDPSEESGAQGYESMIRGINIDCNANTTGTNKNVGAIGLYMNLAQDCSIEDVKVTATNAHTGIRGLPARGWGAVNIEIEGGQYGIDTYITGEANIGSIMAGLILKNQTVSPIRHTGHPLTVVGFDIVTPAGSTVPAVTLATEAADSAHAGALGLVDGTITLTATFNGGVAIDNSALRNIYLRNVYVSGSNSGNLVTSLTTITGTGTRKLIKEYSYTKQSSSNFNSYTLINGVLDQTPASLNNGEYASIQNSAGTAPADLRSRHVWASLPSVDDTNAYDPIEEADARISGSGGVYTATAANFQAILDENPKVFLPKGSYKISGTITLNSNQRLFGASRSLTQLQPNDAVWHPTATVNFITTANWNGATTYLGDLEVIVPKETGYDYFTALNWRAGADSLLHIASIGQTGSGFDTNARSLVTITNNGGGRWYFFGRRSGVAMQNNDFRILDAANTAGNPLWIYGMNMEHSRSDVFAEFTNTNNIRIYGVKTEFAGEYGDGEVDADCTFLSFTNTDNVVLVGYSALRYASNPGYNSVEFLGNSDRVLAALVAPQSNYNPQSTGTLYEEYTGAGDDTVPYPATVSLFKRGTISSTDEGAMVHNNTSYGN